MKNIPHKIFLQVGEDCPSDADFDTLQEVTFSKGKINSNDIEYINADHSPLLAFFKPITFKTKEELNNKFDGLKLNLFDGAGELLKLKHISGTLFEKGIRLYSYSGHFEERELKIEGFKKATGTNNIYLWQNDNTGVLIVVKQCKC